MRAPGGEIHHGRHRHGDPEEDHEGDDVLRVGDGQPVIRRRVEVVQQHGAECRRRERRVEAAEQGRRHRDRQEQQHVVGETEVDGVQQQCEEHWTAHSDQPAPDDPCPPEPGSPGHGQPAPLAGLVMGDQVDVEVGPRVPGHGRADPGPEDVLPGLAPGDAQHDLRGVHAPREVQQRHRDVVPDHMVKRSAQVLDQGPLEGQLLRRGVGQPVAAGDVDGHDLAAGTLLREPRGPPDQRTALGPAGQSDHDPLPRAPDPGDLVLTAVLGQVLVDPVRHPQQRQLPQSGQVPRPEVVGQSRVDLVRLVDVPVGHPPPQRLRGHVDQLDLIRAPDDFVGNGLLLTYTSDRLNHITQRLKMLNVDSRYHVDTRGQQLLHVLPTLGVARAGNVGVRQFVHQSDLRPPGEHGVHVHLGEHGSAVRQIPARNLLQPVQHHLRTLPAVVLHEGDHAVRAPLDTAVRLGQHRVRLADARCRTEVYPKLAATHGLIVFP